MSNSPNANQLFAVQVGASWKGKNPAAKPERESLVGTVLVLIFGNRVLRISRIVTVVINRSKSDMAIHKSHDTQGITIKRRVLFAGLAPVPGERRVSSPFHHQQSSFGLIYRRERQPGYVRHARQGYAVVNIAAEIKSAIAGKRDRIRITPVARTGKHCIVHRGLTAQSGIAFDLFLVPPPKISL